MCSSDLLAINRAENIDLPGIGQVPAAGILTGNCSACCRGSGCLSLPGMNYSGHYISGTHWDREWYRPLPEFRLLLVKLLDELLDLMERNPDFRYFQLDGQTCVLEDYLEIRPENRDRLTKLIADGRILIGPWFTMPDLFCVGDEALVRNLLLGQRISREWGVKPMPVGFVCDMIGRAHV